MRGVRSARERAIALRMLLVLGGLSAFGPLSMDLYLPALPELAHDLDTTDAAAQLTMSACMIGLAVGQLVMGPVADRFGRRRPLLIGVAGYAITSLLCALAPDIGLLVVLRLLQGLAGGAGIVIARAVVRDLYDTDAAAHVFSLLMLVSGVAPVVAPVVGGQLLRLTSWPGLFVLLAVIGCVLVGLCAWAIRETLPPGDRHAGGIRTTTHQFRELLRDGRFLGLTGVQALASVLLFAYISMSPFVLQKQYGLTAQQFSYVFAANSIALVSMGRVGASVVRRLGAVRTLRLGLILGVVFSTVLLLAVVLGAGLPLVLPLLLLAVSGVALIQPSGTALALSDHGARAGTASGVLGLAQFGLSGAIAPLVSLIGATATLMTSTMLGGAGLAALIERLVGRRHAPVAEPAIAVPPDQALLPEPAGEQGRQEATDGSGSATDGVVRH